MGRDGAMREQEVEGRVMGRANKAPGRQWAAR